MAELAGNIRKYYAYQFLSSFQFYYPVFMIFFQSFSLSLAQIGLFLTVYSVTTVLFDIPTGIVADFLGRRKTLLISGLLWVASFSAFSIATDYYGFAVAYALVALGAAFASGTDSSLLYDSLKALKREGEYKKILGSAGMAVNIAVVISFLAGGFLYTIGTRLPYILTTVTSILAIPLILSFVEPPREKPRGRKMIHLRESVLFVMKHPKVKWLTFLGTITMTGVVISYFNNQAYLQRIGLAPEQFGIILAVGMVITALISNYAYKIEKKIGEKASLAIPPIAVAAAYLLTSQSSFMWAFVFLYLINFSRGFSGPVMSDYVNRHVASKNRATVLSVQSSISEISFAIFGPLAGYAADLWSIQTAFLMAGLLIAVVATPVLLFTIKAHGQKR